MERNIYLRLLAPAKARELWLNKIAAECRAPGEEEVALEDSAGRVVSRPVAANWSSPAFHGAAMDGIAVDAGKTFGASVRKPMRLELGKDAFMVNTGNPLPAGMNAVIMIEHVNFEENGRGAVIEKAAFPWQHVRKAGEDMVRTEIILAPGTVIGAYEIGALAAGGAFRPHVWKKPLVAIIPSGSDLATLKDISPEDMASGKRLPEFNSLIFSSMIASAGGEPRIYPISPDDPDEIARAIDAACEDGADLIILNAGTSAGGHDYSPEVIRRKGELLAHGIAMMPGKPAALGLIHAKERKIPILGAPGYPVSATLSLEEFALPLVYFWQKRPAPERGNLTVYPCNALASRPGMEERIRVKLGVVDGKAYAVPLQRGAGTVTSLSRADGIISIPADCEGLNAGEPVKVRLLRPLEQIESGLLAVGSHDNTLDLLDSLLRKEAPRFRLASAHVGSLGGLMALARGQCHLAGSHLLDRETGIYNQADIRRQLHGQPVTLVRLVDREQGLMLKPGNPLNIKSFGDLTRKDVVFINRQRGSGTRVLLDYELDRLGISPADIKGYDEEEYTHMSVASAVQSGRADTGLGARAAANALGLDFIPLGMESYDLVIPARYMEDERIQALLAVARSREFKEAALEMGGYGVEKSGEIVWEYNGD